ncbi:cytochrome P450 CYP736A12-like [Senna tora]|uniref:Cytochrome P450 CYP736A12-like n=1 Tax=Senna tora TaxID=362788 RepID=A0A834WK55_9FABA|nr:cytochrome P450 CYP736A12-like [Senna tora]
MGMIVLAFKFPKGPPPLLVIGNLHQLGTLPHRSLQSLAKRYGPIMSLRLGHVPAIIVSSPEAAQLFLKTHDAVFASRPKSQASDYLSYGSKGMAFSEYGPYWRQMRKLCTLQLLSGSKIEMFGPLRREEVGVLVESIGKSAAAREVVDLSERVGELVEDITYKMVFGRKRDRRFDVKGLVHEALTLVGAFNVADFVPLLAAFDPQGLTRRLKKNSQEIDEMLETIIEEHEHSPDDHDHKIRKDKDFVDILLSSMEDQQNHVIDRTNIKAILLDMTVASADTSTTVAEWALSELMRHPRVMNNLQHELENTIGNNRMVEEADLPGLRYLDMVVKETLRLYPVAPLLVPRESSEDVMIDGYYIRKKSRVIVNAWAIGRDPKVWSDNVEEFYPESQQRKLDGRGWFFSNGKLGVTVSTYLNEDIGTEISIS